jgi:hypothetical protein
MRTTRTLPSSLRLFGQFLLLGFFLTPVMAVGQDSDFAEALRLAQEGDANAQTYIGAGYVEGQRVSQNYVEAVKWWRLAADQGDAKAQYNLGAMYSNGEGVPQDYAEAVKWYQLAADQGDTEAQSNLALIYDSGRSIKHQ